MYRCCCEHETRLVFRRADNRISVGLCIVTEVCPYERPALTQHELLLINNATVSFVFTEYEFAMTVPAEESFNETLIYAHYV